MRLGRSDIERAFLRLGEAALAMDRIVEIAVYGGSALVLTLPARPATRDVDAVILNDQAWLRTIVRDIAEEWGWPEDWLNDGVKGWLSERDREPDATSLRRTYPSEDRPGLRVFVAAPTYLFAMKCMAMRIGGVELTQDRQDIEALGRMLAISTPEAAMALVERYYPASRISAKTAFGIEEIFGPRGGDDH